MKKVVRGKTTNDLNKLVEQRESRGWNRLTDNKLDDSHSGYGVVEWVCVMELKEKEGQTFKKRRWGV